MKETNKYSYDGGGYKLNNKFNLYFLTPIIIFNQFNFIWQ